MFLLVSMCLSLEADIIALELWHHNYHAAVLANKETKVNRDARLQVATTILIIITPMSMINVLAAKLSLSF